MSSQVVSTPSPSGSDKGIKKSVLIVDDDYVFRSCLAESLKMKESNLSVYAAENGEQAVAIIKSLPVDLMITDLRMPAMDGKELVLWMKEYRMATRIIVTSAYIDSDTASGLKEQGYHFLEKPLSLDILTGTICSVLASG
jgi:YesN/AraC family two-component response regulator